jgi:hypothetical protein
MIFHLLTAIWNFVLNGKTKVEKLSIKRKLNSPPIITKSQSRVPSPSPPEKGSRAVIL